MTKEKLIELINSATSFRDNLRIAEMVDLAEQIDKSVRILKKELKEYNNEKESN